MFSFLNLDSPRLSRPKRSRRLKAEPLETRRVLAGAINTCAPLAEVNLADVPSEQLVVPPFGPEIKRDSFAQKARPFKITGGGPAAEGLPLKEGTTATYQRIRHGHRPGEIHRRRNLYSGQSGVRRDRRTQRNVSRRVRLYRRQW